MTELNFQLRTLDWDTGLFGIKMGEIRFPSMEGIEELTENTWHNIIESARQQTYRFLLCQLDASCRKTAAILVKMGAVLGDTLITLERNLHGASETAAAVLESIPAELQVEAATQTDLDQICAIAADSFSYSRFNQDNRFDKAKVSQFYPKWLRDQFGVSEQVYVLRAKWGMNSRPVLGFISLQYLERGRTVIIRLIAVAEKFRGCGYGQLMMDWLTREAVNQDFTRIQVGTQAANVAAIHLYEKNGFHPISTRYRFHLWLDSEILLMNDIDRNLKNN